MHLQFKQNSEIVLPHARNNAGEMAISRFNVEAIIHGLYEYKSKSIWLNPVLKESFPANRKLEMPTTLMLWQYACKIIDGEIKTVRHVPCKISIYTMFDFY